MDIALSPTRSHPLTSQSLLALFESTPVAQIVMLPDDPVFTIVAVNDTYVRASGLARDRLVGHGVFEVFPDNPADPAADGVRNLRASLLRVTSARQPDRMPVQRYDIERPQEKGGGFEERYWNACNTPVFSPEGRVEYILHSVEEVTEKVLSEKKAERAMRALQLTRQRNRTAGERRLRRAQRAGRVGSFEWLLKENRAFWTPELEELYGLPEGTFETAGFDGWRRWVLPEDADRVVDELEGCMAQHFPDCVFEFRAVLPDGTLRWLRGQAQLFYDETGAPERMIGINIDIDPQKQAEDHLRYSEERLRAIFDGTYEYIGLLAPDGTLLEANRASLEFGHSKREEVVGRPFWETVWFADTPGVPEQVRHAVARAAAGEFVRFEATVHRPSGEWPTFDLSFHPIRNESGEVILIVPESRNITEHKESKERLQHQWHLFDTALSHTPDHTYIFDLQCHFTYANRALLDFWQKPLEEVVGKNASQLNYPNELAARIERQLKQVIDTKRPVRDHTAFPGAEGEIRHFEYIFVPVLDPGGIVEAVAGSSRDITDRERMQKALSASEQKLQQVFAQAPVAIVVFRGRDFVVEMANPTYRAQLRGRDLVGRPFAEVVPELGQDVWDVFHRVFDTGEPFVANEWQIPYDADRDGIVEDHWFNVAYNPLRDFDGAISGMIAVMTDVTAHVVSRRELERVNRELEEFSYVASHDLQEPLRMVNIYTHLLLQGIKNEDETINRYAGFVQQGVSRMQTLLGDLLTFSRAVHTEDLPVGNADLSASLAEALSVVNGRVEESGAVITAGPLPTVRGDTKQLAHVFQNLLSNSLKYRRKDLAPAIHISAEHSGNQWIVSVQDNGIGFDSQYAERIFGLFKRLHRDEYPGTGLGLAICQRIVTRYGGRMWAEGKLGEGATLRFSLPEAENIMRAPTSAQP